MSDSIREYVNVAGRMVEAIERDQLQRIADMPDEKQLAQFRMVDYQQRKRDAAHKVLLEWGVKSCKFSDFTMEIFLDKLDALDELLDKRYPETSVERGINV